ncbi:mpv17-like protein 2 isoform X2 [Prorops nasuta]|uniref:mpv17-like protein 2 isoform X2 n=1 Tax=Prorops nasuta TaxID=863751 RepID=UPI0034CDE4BB
MGFKRKLFGKYLLITNTVSCGVMMATADIIQQRSEHLKKQYYDQDLITKTPGRMKQFSRISYEHDYQRTKNMMIVGLLQGPFNHYFYAILDRFLPGKNAMSILKKTVLDQSIASPFTLGIFFIGLGTLENRHANEINEEVKMKFVETWKVDCCFWPPTQLVNFIFIPKQYRVLYINFMTMIYDIFLSYMKYDANY